MKKLIKLLEEEKYSISDLLRQQSAKGVPFTLAQGGRAGYAYGNEVTADDPGVVSRIPPEQANLIEGGQRYEKEMWDVWQEFYDRFPDSEDHTEENFINFLARNQFEDAMNTPGYEGGILSLKDIADSITKQGVTNAFRKLTRDSGAEDYPGLAQGGRIGYDYGGEVTADAPGVRSQVPEARRRQIEGNQMAEEALQKIMYKFIEKFPGIDSTEMSLEDMIAMLQQEGVWETEGAGIMDIGAGMDMITPESVRSSTQRISRGDTQYGDPYGGHQFDHPIDEMRYGNAYGGRPGYGLGSLVKSVFKGAKKGVKSLVKSVKKFAKSDLGKMALMYMATAGMGNIGANWGGAKNWGTMFGKQGWLSPTNVMGNLGKSWGNIGKAFKGAPDVSKAASKLTNQYSPIADMGYNANLSTLAKGATKANPTSFLSGIGQSFKNNPFPWIAGTAGLAGLYTAKNPGVDNIDELMRNYKGEVSDWDKMLADIRSGKNSTAFSTANTDFPYPDYMNLAQGGRIGRAEGGLMDLGGMEKDYRAEGGFVPIGGKEKADDVPARLSRNEFVFTADAVRNAGGGDVDKGSEVMENIMTNLEKGGSISEESQGLEGARDMFEVSERLSEVV